MTHHAAAALMCACVFFLQIDIVITCCSVYNPTPSMAACLVNKFGMRHDVLTYHLSGMGCSSSLVSIDMAKNLLKVNSSSALSVGLQICQRPAQYQACQPCPFCPEATDRVVHTSMQVFTEDGHRTILSQCT